MFAGGFSIGQSTTAQPTSTTGFSFDQSTTAQPTSTTGFGFGFGSQPTTTGGFSFGQSTTAQPTSNTGFGFGFGSQPTTGGFSSGNINQSTVSPFSTTSQQTNTVSFGNTNQSTVSPFSTTAQPSSTFSFGRSTTASSGFGSPSTYDPFSPPSLIPTQQSNTPLGFGAPQPTTTSANLKNQIVSLQQFDGSWDETSIRYILGNNSQAAIDSAGSYNKKIWITALVIVYLELKCSDSKSSWEIVANKAKTFIAKHLFSQEKMEKDKITPYTDSLLAKAKEILKNYS
jgi:hypothetical protein